MEKGPLPLSSTPKWPPTTTDSEHELQLRVERQAVRKLDYTILPIISLFYLVSFLVCFFLSLTKNTASVNKFSGSIQYW